MSPTTEAPIELYTHPSPNGFKVTIALEELGLPYVVRPINVFAGEGQAPSFLALNPAGKIPIIRDNGLVLTESDAILLYLADKAGRLIPSSGPDRLRAIELLFLQASLQGPMFGQRTHFSLFAPESVPYGIRRYEEQCEVIDALLARTLAHNDYFLGPDYSIVDIAFYGWYAASLQCGFDLDAHPPLAQWFERLSARPAVVRGLAIPGPLPTLPPRRRLEPA